MVQYRELSDVAALQQMLGSPVTAALLPRLKADSMLSLLAAWPSGLLGENVIGILGATYDVEIQNGLGFVTREGIVSAFHELSDLDLDGLTAGPLDYTQVGEPPSTATHISQPADVPGGLKIVEVVGEQAQ